MCFFPFHFINFLDLLKIFCKHGTYFSHFFNMFVAKAWEYFQVASDHFLVPDNKVPETVWLVSISGMLAVGGDHKVYFEACLRFIKSFWAVKKSPPPIHFHIAEMVTHATFFLLSFPKLAHLIIVFLQNLYNAA